LEVEDLPNASDPLALAARAPPIRSAATACDIRASTWVTGTGEAGSKGTQPPQLVSGNSQYLPFPDGVFDAVLDGAGIKYYSDKRRALREMLRVVKPGGKVLVTELGMPPEKRPTLRQRLLLLWIPRFREGPPRDAVPSDARDVKLNWDAGETFYALEFRRVPEHGR